MKCPTNEEISFTAVYWQIINTSKLQSSEKNLEYSKQIETVKVEGLKMRHQMETLL